MTYDEEQRLKRLRDQALETCERAFAASLEAPPNDIDRLRLGLEAADRLAALWHLNFDDAYGVGPVAQVRGYQSGGTVSVAYTEVAPYLGYASSDPNSGYEQLSADARSGSRAMWVNDMRVSCHDDSPALQSSDGTTTDRAADDEPLSDWLISDQGNNDDEAPEGTELRPSPDRETVRLLHPGLANQQCITGDRLQELDVAVHDIAAACRVLQQDVFPVLRDAAASEDAIEDAVVELRGALAEIMDEVHYATALRDLYDLSREP